MSSNTPVRVAATQMPCFENRDINIRTAEVLIREAASKGSNIILLQELFQTLYFCQEQNPKYFDYAEEEKESKMIRHFRKLAKELKVVLPINFFEKKNNNYYNTVVCIDATGEIIGKYRKSHIPDNLGYQEKYYFSPGDTGFKVFNTSFGNIGVGICWDQWFPESVRSMVLLGAEVIFFPTAMGTNPQDPTSNLLYQWERVITGQSAVNMIPIVVSNRVGIESFPNSSITFYGSSFITNNTGEILIKADCYNQSVVYADLDLKTYSRSRASWGLIRDRRPELYKPLLSKDGDEDA